MTAQHRRARRSRFGFVWSIAIRSVLLAFASLVAAMVLWTLIPALFGYRPNLVTSGSMTPRVSVGDVVLTRPIAPGQLRPGQIVLVEREGGHVLHRIRSVTHTEVVTQGDANPTSDFPAAKPDQVVGVGRILIPRIGLPVTLAADHPGLGLVVAGAALIVVGGRGVRRGRPNGSRVHAPIPKFG